MNCDQAFDLMTNPALDDSPALHEHLDLCPRCRQMYETLSPALGLFAPVESPAAMSFDKPESAGASPVEIAERVAVSLSQDSLATPLPRRRQSRILPISLAVGIVSFTTALALLVLFSGPSIPTSLESVECTWINRNSTENEQSEAVIQSCLACHIGKPAQTSDVSRPDPRLTVLAGLIN